MTASAVVLIVGGLVFIIGSPFFQENDKVEYLPFRLLGIWLLLLGIATMLVACEVL